MISHTRYIKYDIGRCTINDITNKKGIGADVVSQSHFKITVEDGTMLEVKIDKAKRVLLVLFIFSMAWLNIWTVIKS